jgi:VWFA-related protein
MMRKLALILALAGMALPALGARRVTADQLEQAIAALHGKRDVDLAWQLSDLQLTERLSAARLAGLEKGLPGKKSRQALVALADESDFLDPPAEEIPATATPDFAAQRQIMGLVAAYVGKTIPQLPNFFAARETTRMEDTPQLETSPGFVPYQPLHLVGNSSATVLYRNGREVVDTGTAKKPRPMDEGLNTMGVFGPILGTVLLDAARSKLAWSHWEQGVAGPEAVFKYEVPKEKSHYEVNYCCVAEEAATVVANLHPFRQIVAYHGEMVVDPASGTILRLSVEAELRPADPISRADILVVYGPVEIGGRTYFCPVRSVSISVAQMVQVVGPYAIPMARQIQPLQTSLNDVLFEKYHLFRADARVLTPEEAMLAGVPPAPGSADASAAGVESAGAAPAAPMTAEPAAATVTEPSAPVAAEPTATEKNPPAGVVASAAPSGSASEAAVPAPATAAPPAPASEAPAPEISVAAAGLPDVPETSRASDSSLASAPETGFTLHSTSRLVDVGVVAYDKKGHPVTDLKPGDFEIYDDGAKQQIRFFSQAAEAAARGVTATGNAQDATAQEPVFSNRPASAANGAPGTVGAESSVTILMIDAGNLAWGDLTYAREEMLRFLKTLPAEEQVGLYVMKSYGFQILLEPTTDHARIAATLTKWMPSAQDLARAQDEEQRNRQHFDWVHSVSDLSHVNGNESTDPETYTSGPDVVSASAQPTDARLLKLGSNPGRDALFVLEGVARHLTSIPGHKSLIWIASDNVLADWTGQAATKEDQGSDFIHSIVLRTQESLNDAHVSIYPLDASQLEAGGIGADIGTRNVLVVGKSDRDQSLVGDTAPGMKPGRVTAAMQQDTHPIQSEFRELAEATGGRALRRAGDIAAELNGIVEDGRAAYLLSFTPDMPPDDKYHLLKVKVTGRPDIKLRYRTGYEYDKEPATLKDRFRQAIWQPTDVSDIAISAKPEKDAKGGFLQLNIAGTDLELAQQGERWVGKVDIFLVERDDEGVHAKVSGQKVGLRLQPATYQKILHEGLSFDERVESKLESGSLRVVVVDEASGRMGSITVPDAALEHLQ